MSQHEYQCLNCPNEDLFVEENLLRALIVGIRTPEGVAAVTIAAESRPMLALDILGNVEGGDVTPAERFADSVQDDSELIARALACLGALRIRRARRQTEEAEEAAKVAAEAEAKAAAEQQELRELAEKLYAIRTDGLIARPFSERWVQQRWLDVARAAKAHFQGRES